MYLSAWVGLELESGGHGVIVVEAEGGGRKYRRVARVASDDINWGSPKVAIEPFTIGGKTYRWVHISPSLTNISIDERLCVVVWYPWDFAPGEPGGCDNVCVSRIR